MATATASVRLPSAILATLVPNCSRYKNRLFCLLSDLGPRSQRRVATYIVVRGPRRGEARARGARDIAREIVPSNLGKEIFKIFRARGSARAITPLF